MEVKRTNSIIEITLAEQLFDIKKFIDKGKYGQVFLVQQREPPPQIPVLPIEPPKKPLEHSASAPPEQGSGGVGGGRRSGGGGERKWFKKKSKENLRDNEVGTPYEPPLPPVTAIPIISTKKTYALKIIPRNVKSCTIEHSILKKLKHPNIVRYERTYQDKDNLYLLMEYVGKETLLSYTQKRGKLSESEARLMMFQILNAVEYCHKKGVVHRDIKLENIMLTDDPRIAKLIDFGFAYYWDDTFIQTSFCGSMHYAAPEILTGICYRGPEVDIWSIGVLLYGLVHGCLPFDGKKDEDVQRAILAKNPPFSPNSTPSLRHLLRGIFTDKRTRYSVAQIRDHPWMKGCDDVTVLERITLHTLHRPRNVTPANRFNKCPTNETNLQHLFERPPIAPQNRSFDRDVTKYWPHNDGAKPTEALVPIAEVSEDQTSSPENPSASPGTDTNYSSSSSSSSSSRGTDPIAAFESVSSSVSAESAPASTSTTGRDVSSSGSKGTKRKIALTESSSFDSHTNGHVSDRYCQVESFKRTFHPTVDPLRSQNPMNATSGTARGTNTGTASDMDSSNKTSPHSCLSRGEGQRKADVDFHSIMAASAPTIKPQRTHNDPTPPKIDSSYVGSSARRNVSDDQCHSTGRRPCQQQQQQQQQQHSSPAEALEVKEKESNPLDSSSEKPISADKRKESFILSKLKSTFRSRSSSTSTNCTIKKKT